MLALETVHETGISGSGLDGNYRRDCPGGRYAATQMEYFAQPGQWAPDVPLVVLVDRLSASSSEILAGALRDHERAVLVGEATYGKGTVQSLLQLRNGNALKLENFGTKPGVLRGELLVRGEPRRPLHAVMTGPRIERIPERATTEGGEYLRLGVDRPQ